MSQSERPGPIFDGALPADAARPEMVEDIAQAVIAAYMAAVAGSERDRAFDAALRAYRRRHPTAPEVMTRRRVAEILCFARK